MQCSMQGLLLALSSVGLLLGGSSSTSWANPPQTTVREFQVPQPPVTVRRYMPVDEQVPQPPRTFKEVTKTYVVETTPRAYAAPPVSYTVPAAKVRYVAPAYVPPPAFFVEARYGAKIAPGPRGYATPTGRPAAPGIIAVPGAPFPFDGPIRRGIRSAFGYDPG